MDVSQQLDSVRVFPGWQVSRAGIASAQDYAACRQIMQAASKNYSFASKFFPADKLQHVEALYALLRVGDDRVDVSHAGFGSRLEAIEDWENAYWRAFQQGDSPDPVLRAYLNTAIECGIPEGLMAAYFRAMKDDLTVTRFPTFSHLVYYMEGSAIPVGRAMTYILGVRAPFYIEDALLGADSLSIAMQLSNFWRDIGADWNIQRVYIPQEDLERFHYTEADLAARRITPNFVDLLEFEMSRTECFYAQACCHVPMLASGRWAVMSGLEVYRAILNSIRRNRYNVFTRRAGSSMARKIGLAARAWWLTL
jgi:15-cis-phytoene synthase